MLSEVVREKLRLGHYARRTEEAYWGWGAVLRVSCRSIHASLARRCAAMPSARPGRATGPQELRRSSAKTDGSGTKSAKTNPFHGFSRDCMSFRHLHRIKLNWNRHQRDLNHHQRDGTRRKRAWNSSKRALNLHNLDCPQPTLDWIRTHCRWLKIYRKKI